MDDLLREFLTETNESLDLVDVELVRFEQDPTDQRILANIFRLVHTIKGTCGFLGLPRLEALAHAAETLMGKVRDGLPVTTEAVTLILTTIDRVKSLLAELERSQQEPPGCDTDLIGELEQAASAAAPPEPQVSAAETGSLTYQVLTRRLRPGEATLDDLERAFRETPGPSEPTRKASAKDEVEKFESRVASQSIRVNLETLERLMTMVSELVLTRNQLLEIVRRNEDSEFKAPLQRLSTVTAELQEGVMKTRMQPIGNAWQKLPRIVRDLAGDLGKDIEFETEGAETELDRQVLDVIKDPLTHMVRNSADHGIEMPAERRRAGKPAKGTIRLSAYHQGGYIIIDIADDGRGLDLARIKATAIARGLASEAEIDKMADAQVAKFIFAPGFSTMTEVTNVSGRGVGMDVVRTNIDQIGGTIDVKSVLGQGTSFAIKIPLTLVIVAALLVQASGECFAIPQLSVIELVRTQNNSEHRIERIKETPVLRLRDKLLPLVSLKTLLQLDDSRPAQDDFIVVTQVGNQTFGIMVDSVLHTEEIVVKPLSTGLRGISLFSGNTILGDGSVIMIIDPNGIAAQIGSATTAAADAQIELAQAIDAVETTALLLFRAGSPELKAVPLSLVTRLEEIDVTKIELSNGRHMVQYRGHLMPLVHANANVHLRTAGAQPLLVFSDGGRSLGLMVDEIVDIVEDRLDIEVLSDVPGVLGSAVIQGQASEILDIAHFLPLAYQDWFGRRGKPSATDATQLLLVDDSAFFRDMLTPVLKAAGYRVTSVASAEDALALVQRGQHFDVIVSDIEMDGLDGFDFASALAANERTAPIPLIALASTASPAVIERGRAAGFRNFVAKFDRQGLLAALKQVVLPWEQAA